LNFIYNIGILLAGFILKCIAPLNKKLKLGTIGRSLTFKTLEQHITPSDRVLWFHCASLGEFEQGLPVFQALRTHYSAHKIVLSFFSPSGYTIRKNTTVADVVVYLPLDSKRNALKFVTFLKPELSIFVKYDIWPNYLQALKDSNLKTILISAAFRAQHIYFKPYGSFFKNALQNTPKVND
jgi:3-deoxy-D-manno-octulosonic-acid transferase